MSVWELNEERKSFRNQENYLQFYVFPWCCCCCCWYCIRCVRFFQWDALKKTGSRLFNSVDFSHINFITHSLCIVVVVLSTLFTADEKWWTFALREYSLRFEFVRFLFQSFNIYDSLFLSFSLSLSQFQIARRRLKSVQWTFFFSLFGRISFWFGKQEKTNVNVNTDIFPFGWWFDKMSNSHIHITNKIWML